MSISGGTPSQVLINGANVTEFISGIDFSNPITGLYRPDGSLEGVRINYEAMTPAERTAIEAWVAAHGIDPGRVPVQVDIGFDPDTEEWRFPLYVRGQPGGIRLDRASGELIKRVVRRRRNPAAVHQLEQAWGMTRGNS